MNHLRSGTTGRGRSRGTGRAGRGRPRGKVLAGGQSVVPLLNMRLAATPLNPTYEILTAADGLPDEWLEARGGGQRSATTPTFEDIEAGTLAEIVRTHDVTHRDIRPDNLFRLDGHRVIGDLGIAHHADSAGLTEVSIKAGSWGYLPLPGEAASALFQVVSSATSRPASC